MTGTKKLTAKQRRFIEEYMIDKNATQAAIRAGYSKKTAYRTGADNLMKPQIAAAIQVKLDELSKKTQITAERVLKEYAKIAFADIKDFTEFRTAKTVVGHDEETGELIIDYKQIVDVKPSDQVDGTLINEISLSRDGTLKVKLHDKVKALEALAKHLNLFVERHEVSGPGGSAIQVNFTLPRPKEKLPEDPSITEIELDEEEASDDRQ